MKMAEFFLAHRHSKASNDVFHMLSGLRVAANNKLHRPVAVTVVDPVVVVGGNDNIDVRRPVFRVSLISGR